MQQANAKQAILDAHPIHLNKQFWRIKEHEERAEMGESDGYGESRSWQRRKSSMVIMGWDNRGNNG